MRTVASSKSTSTESLLPNGPEESGDEEFNLDDLRVNFSSEEADSEGRSFDAIPSGIYHCAIAKVELRKAGPTSKNPGKPYYNITFNVQSHKNPDMVNRKVWGSVMLFDGALYSYSQLAKAIGRRDVLPAGDNAGYVLKPDELLGEECLVIVQKKRDTYKEQQNDDGEKLFKNDVNGYKALSDTSTSPSSGKQSMLPG